MEKNSNISICLHRTIGMFSVVFGSTSINRNLLLFHLQALTLSSVYGFGHHNIRKGIKLLGEHPKAGHRNGEGSGGEVMRCSWGHLVYSAWRRGDSGGDLIVVYRFLMRGSAGA